MMHSKSQKCVLAIDMYATGQLARPQNVCHHDMSENLRVQ